MSYEVDCPHCNKEFTPDDHYESGSYDCPYCLKQIWIDVEYDVTYDAFCAPDDHKWLPLKLDPNHQQCQRCGRLQQKQNTEKAGE